MPTQKEKEFEEFINSCETKSQLESMIKFRDTLIKNINTFISEYSEFTDTTAQYKDAGLGTYNALSYVVLGLVGEAGEIANKTKKISRDDNQFITDIKREDIKKELGDVFWYWIRACKELNLDPHEVIKYNQKKLQTRLDENKIKGSGDDR